MKTTWLKMSLALLATALFASCASEPATTTTTTSSTETHAATVPPPR